ncbi:MAG TPA: GNAT family protein [Caulobacteraceae bacterium]
MDSAWRPIRLPESLTDGVVLLDGHTVEDAEAHLAGEDEEMMRRFDSPRRATFQEAKAAMQRWIDARAAGGPMFAYALRQPSGALIGGCEIRLLSPQRANISYWVYPAFRKAGRAARALALLCEAVAAIPGLEQLEAHIDPDNTASRRLAEKAGFVQAGTVEDESWAGERSTRILYARQVVRTP